MSPMHHEFVHQCPADSPLAIAVTSSRGQVIVSAFEAGTYWYTGGRALRCKISDSYPPGSFPAQGLVVCVDVDRPRSRSKEDLRASRTAVSGPHQSVRHDCCCNFS